VAQCLGCAQTVTSRWQLRTEDELSIETASLETAVCVADVLEGNTLRDARPDGVSCQLSHSRSC
jgi:hypothetical protein